jgi:hypothetical protein
MHRHGGMKNTSSTDPFTSNIVPEGATIVIPAASAPSREGVEFACVAMRDPRGARFLLEHEGGALVLVLACGTSLGPFSTGRLVVESIDPLLGEKAVDRIASWLGFRLGAVTHAGGVSAATPKDSWVYFGRGEGPESGWDVYKLFLARGQYSAEVFLRIDSSGRRAQFLEKWDRYREDLVAIFERAVHPAAPRVVLRDEPAEQPLDGRRVLAFEGGLEIAIPTGWRVKETNSIHRMTDPDETMAIEFSFVRFPPLDAGFPNVVERVTMARDRTARRATIHSARGDGFEFAWFEAQRKARDTKNRSAPKRPAIDRVLVASNEWVQVVITSAWWLEDRAAGEAVWNEVIASLRLAGRLGFVQAVGVAS